jgi:predicted metal-binding protein
MSKIRNKEQAELVQLRNYPAPWKGELLLVCTKCTKKLKKHDSPFANIRKWFKKRGKQADDGLTVRVIGVNCVKMCPKGGITVATQQQLGQSPAQVSIVRSEADLEALYANLSGNPAA